MTDHDAFRAWLFAFAVTAIAVVVCIAYVDRPVAVFFEAHLRHTAAWGWLAGALAPLNLAIVVALLFLLGCGSWIISGRPLRSWTQIPLLCAWAAMWAAAAETIFKRIFGRDGPDPRFVREHIYEFRLLHGDPRWESFPSGSAAISAAIVAVLWILLPRWRALGATIVVLLCLVVVIANYHWIGDVIAGAFLGASIGWMTVRLQRRL